MIRPAFFLLATSLLALSAPLWAEPFTLVPTAVTEWKAVYGTVEAKDRIPARARIGGVLVELLVAEGDAVAAGQELARIVDDKLEFQLAALAAQTEAVAAQLANAEADLQRGEDLLKNGVTTAQRVDGLRTQVDVLKGQIAALEAQSDVIAQQTTFRSPKARWSCRASLWRWWAVAGPSCGSRCRSAMRRRWRRAIGSCFPRRTSTAKGRWPGSIR